MMSMDEKYMKRCFDLARLGANYASPNPMVGSVIVYKNRVIGEGWHQAYGTAHAEVNAVNDVSVADSKYLKNSTMYVSLEPCCIFGRTPPCSDLIIKNKIPKVVISCLDATPEVAGNSVKKLQAVGIEVVTGVLEKEGLELAKIRNTFAGKNRPYIILKYARSQDGFIGKEQEQVWLTNAYSRRLVHKWRSEIDAILIGTNTAIVDNPELNNRYWSGPSPLRAVIDKELKIDQKHHIYNDEQPTLIFTENQVSGMGFEKTSFLPVDFTKNIPQQIVETLAKGNVASILIEGGAFTISSFVQANLWDEARVFQTEKLIGAGVAAPKLSGEIVKKIKIDNDALTIIKKTS